MFRITVVFSLICLFIANPTASVYRIGVKGGLFLSMFHGTDARQLSRSTTIPRNDFSASVFFRTQYSTRLSGQIELVYAKKGNREQLKYTSIYYRYPDFFTSHNCWEERYKLDYIELPVLLNISLLNSGRNELSFYTGPFLSFLISAKKNITDNETITYTNIHPYTPKWDYGINTGIEYNITAGKGFLSFDIRYSAGFASVQRPTATDFLINASAVTANRKNSALLFMTGYTYAF